MFNGSRPDAIVCDLLLPDTTGIRLPEESRRLDPEWRVPLVAISGHPDAEDPARHAGFDAFIPKLISPLLPLALAELMRGPK
jgi:CheY-like chemotaxis protein